MANLLDSRIIIEVAKLFAFAYASYTEVHSYFPLEIGTVEMVCSKCMCICLSNQQQRCDRTVILTNLLLPAALPANGIEMVHGRLSRGLVELAEL